MPLTFDESGALLINDLSGKTFIGLTDTPLAYAGNANKLLFVNATPDAVEFASGAYWDDVNSRLGINQDSPQNDIDVADSGVIAFIQGAGAGENINMGRNFYNDGSWKRLVADNNAQRVQFGQTGFTTFAAPSDANATADSLITWETIMAIDGPSKGVRFGGSGSAARKIHAIEENASTSVIIPIARLESQVSGGAGAAGHGPSLEFTGETTTTENQSMAEVAARWSVATHASRRARVEIRAAYIGTEVLVGIVEAPATASADGNARGVGAVDLQGYRTGASQVAAAAYSVMIGGQRSEIASGSGAAIIGGYDHSIGAAASQAGILAGYDHLIDGAPYAAMLAGREGQAINYAQVVRSSGMFSSQGDAQASSYVARIDRATHAVNTWYSLYLDGSSAQMVIRPSTAWTFKAFVVGLTANAAQQWSYEIVGLIERDNAGNTTLAASTTTTIFESDANYDAQAVADNVNEALEIQVRRTGGVDYSVQWVASITVAECTH